MGACAVTPRASHTHLLSRPRNTLWRGRGLCVGPSEPLPTSVKDRKPPPCPRELALRQGTRPRVAQGPLCCPLGWRPGEARICPSVLCLLVLVWACRTPSPCLDSPKSKLGLFTGRKGLSGQRGHRALGTGAVLGQQRHSERAFPVLNMGLGDSYF